MKVREKGKRAELTRVSVARPCLRSLPTQPQQQLRIPGCNAQARLETYPWRSSHHGSASIPLLHI
jgi:hypothetical protein